MNQMDVKTSYHFLPQDILKFQDKRQCSGKSIIYIVVGFLCKRSSDKKLLERILTNM